MVGPKAWREMEGWRTEIGGEGGGVGEEEVRVSPKSSSGSGEA